MPAVDSIAQVNEFATNTALSVWAATGNFIVLIGLAGSLFLFAWYVGRAQLAAVLLAFYAAFAIYIVFPFASLLPTAPPLTAFLAHAALYGALTVVFYFILRRMVVSDFLGVGIFGLAALSILGAAFLIALAYHLFPLGTLYQFSPLIANLFEPDKYFFWWFISPAVGLFFLAR